MFVTTTSHFFCILCSFSSDVEQADYVDLLVLLSQPLLEQTGQDVDDSFQKRLKDELAREAAKVKPVPMET